MRSASKTLITASIILFIAIFSVPFWGLSQKVSAVNESEYMSLKIFTDVIGIVKEYYAEDTEVKELVYAAVKGMLRDLDPHSSFLEPEDYKEMQVDTRGSFGGIGIEIGIRDNILTVVSPIEDTPAFRAGVKAKDKIVKIEGTSTKNMTLTEAVKLMRGKAGTELTIHIMRESFNKPKPFDLTRAIIKIKSVKFRKLDDGIGYVRITQFQEKTTRDLRKALKELDTTSAEFKGLVLDLRNNPGGLLPQAVDVSDVFLSKGIIVTTKGRKGNQEMEFAANSFDTEPDYPIIVIVNAGSASASEIVAGAIQDHSRGVILGTTTFGKGSVQTIMPLKDGSAVRLTTSKYYTPSGRSIQAKGIEPDIEVGETPEGHMRERDLPKHLRGDNEDAEEAKAEADVEEPKEGVEDKDTDKSEDENTADASETSDEDEDIQLKRAVEYLKSWDIFQGTLRKAS